MNAKKTKETLQIEFIDRIDFESYTFKREKKLIF